jgi:uncharacterized phage protein (predicted DNA packaging)
MAFVTLDETKAALVVDFEDDDALLTLLIDAASESVAQYLKVDQETLEPTPATVKVATIILAGYLYKNRDKNPEDAFQPGYLPAPVMSLLYPLRDPTVA